MKTLASLLRNAFWEVLTKLRRRLWPAGGKLLCAEYSHLGHTMSVHLIVECAPADAEHGCGLLFIAVNRREG